MCFINHLLYYFLFYIYIIRNANAFLIYFISLMVIYFILFIHSFIQEITLFSVSMHYIFQGTKTS